MNQKEKESISRSFKKIKEEMSFLYTNMIDLREQLNHLTSELYKLNDALDKAKPSSSTYTAPNQQKIENPADNLGYKKDLSPKSHISIGNEGVPADRQQTVSRHPADKDTQEIASSIRKETIVDKPQETINQDIKIDNLSIILEKLKKELKQKFKNLTNQEILVFSIIYTLNEELSEVSYKDIALKANLTESSIRDYIARLEHKGIPLIKEKKNNKSVIIKIPDELKNITTLDNLTKLKK